MTKRGITWQEKYLEQFSSLENCELEIVGQLVRIRILLYQLGWLLELLPMHFEIRQVVPINITVGKIIIWSTHWIRWIKNKVWMEAHTREKLTISLFKTFGEYLDSIYKNGKRITISIMVAHYHMWRRWHIQMYFIYQMWQKNQRKVWGIFLELHQEIKEGSNYFVWNLFTNVQWEREGCI